MGTDHGLYRVEDVPFESADAERILDCGRTVQVERFDHLEVDETTRERRLARLEEVKEEPDDEAVDTRLEALSDPITSDESVTLSIIEAVKAYATMGEIMDVFEDHRRGYQEEITLV